MAKHSALFDVMARRKPAVVQSRPGFLRSISTWFSARSRSGAIAPVYRSVSTTTEPAEAVSLGLGNAAGESGPAARNALHIDKRRREVSVSLSFTAAGIGAVALLTALAVAYMAGQKSGRPHVALNDRLSDDRQMLPPGGVGDRLPETPTDQADPSRQADLPAISVVRPSPSTGGAAPAKPKRKPDLNYVVIQSYPPSEEKMAREAVELLNKNGIECTIERDIPGWKGLYVVVGTLGFTHQSANPELDAYKKRIKQIGENVGKKNSFKAFDPTPFKWKRAD